MGVTTPLPPDGQNPWGTDFRAWAADVEDDLDVRLSDSALVTVVASNTAITLATGMDPTGATDSAPALVASINSCPDGHTLVVPKGTYLISTAVSKSLAVGTRVDIDFSGSTFIHGRSSGYCLSFNGAYDASVGVSAMTQVTIPASEANWTNNDTTGLQFTTASAQVWQRGDLVKVIADDILEGGRLSEVAGVDARYGQTFKVHSVSGTTVILTGVLREFAKYTINVRAARLQKREVAIRNLIITMSDAALVTPGTRAGILFSDLIGPKADNIVIARSASSGMAFKGCWTYYADRCSVLLAKDDPDNGVFGYGIIDISSMYGLITNYTAGKVRHAFTDDSVRGNAGVSAGNYGRSYGTRIVNGYAEGGSLAAWDTHLFGENHWFINCMAVDVVTGFNLRGIKHKVINGYVLNAKTAYAESTESDSGWSWGHVLRGLHAEGISGFVLSQYKQNDPLHPLVGVREARKSYVSNVTAIGAPGGRLHYSVNSTAEVRNVSYESAATVGAANPGIVRMVNSEVEASNYNLDLRANTSTGLSVFYQNKGLFKLAGYRVDWTITVATPAWILDAIDTGTTSFVTGGAVTEIAPSQFVTGSILGWTASGAGNAALGRNAGYLNFNSTTAVVAANYIAPIADIDAPAVVFTYTNTSNIIVPTLPNGRRFGQHMLLYVNPTAGGTITVKHGDATYNTTLTGATDKVLAATESLLLVWSGSTWNQV